MRIDALAKMGDSTWRAIHTYKHSRYITAIWTACLPSSLPTTFLPVLSRSAWKTTWCSLGCFCRSQCACWSPCTTRDSSTRRSPPHPTSPPRVCVLACFDRSNTVGRSLCSSKSDPSIQLDPASFCTSDPWIFCCHRSAARYTSALACSPRLAAHRGCSKFNCDKSTHWTQEPQTVHLLARSSDSPGSLGIECPQSILRPSRQVRDE